MSIVLALCLSSSPFGEYPDSQEIQQAVQHTLDQFFPEVTNEKREALSGRLTRIFASVRSEEQRNRLIEQLPGVAQYHANLMDYYKSRGNVQLPQQLLMEGYDVEFERLEARVSRAASIELTESDHYSITEQINTIVATAKEALKEKLSGDVGSAYVDRQFEGLKETWAGLADKPYNAYLSTPLTAGELAGALADIRSKVNDFAPVLLTREDLLSPDRLQALKINSLIETVRNATISAPRFGLHYDAGLIQRQGDWASRADKAMKDAVKERAVKAKRDQEEARLKREAELKKIETPKRSDPVPASVENLAKTNPRKEKESSPPQRVNRDRRSGKPRLDDFRCSSCCYNLYSCLWDLEDSLAYAV